MPKHIVVDQNTPQTPPPAVDPSNAPVGGAPAPEATPEVPAYQAAWDGLSEDVRTGIANSLYESYNQRIAQEYPDIIALASEAQANPKLREALKTFASDQELREFIADGGTIEQLRGLQKDPAYREFLFKDATEAYRKYPQPNAEPAADPRDSRLNALEQRFEDEMNQRSFTGYISGRQAEMEALKNAAPDLRENNGLLAHIVTLAENNFKIAAANSGININQPDNVWAAQAVRKGIRPPAYLDVHRQYQTFAGKTPPPAAPSGSAPARNGKSVQAPRTRVDAAKLTDAERRAQTIAAMQKNSEKARLAAVK